MPSIEKKIAYKSFVALNSAFAIMGLLHYLVAHILLLAFRTGSK